MILWACSQWVVENVGMSGYVKGATPAARTDYSSVPKEAIQNFLAFSRSR